MRPAIRITLDGIDITGNLIPAPFGIPLEGGGRVIAGGALTGGPLLSISVSDQEGKKSDSVDLEIDNREGFPAPKKGAKMKVWIGYVETGLVYKGTFDIDSWKKRGRPKTLSVSAKAAGFTTEIKEPKSRSYHETTVGEIVQKIAGKHGRSAIVHPSLASIKIGHIDQSAESDLNFLTRLARRVGGNFKLGDEKLIMNKLGGGSLPSGGAAPAFTITEVGCTEWDCSGSERGDYQSVSAAWQNVQTGEREWVNEGEGKPRYRDRKLYKTEEEARRAAKSQKEAMRLGKKTFTATFPGRPEMMAGGTALAAGFDADVDGAYVIRTVTDKVDNSGYSTSIDCHQGNESGDT